MEILFEWVFWFLLFINMAAFLLFGVDKSWARRGSRRVSEFNLLFVSLIGGVFGGMLGMALFRHKTRKGIFKFLMIAILVVDMLILSWIIIGYGLPNWLENIK